MCAWLVVFTRMLAIHTNGIGIWEKPPSLNRTSRIVLISGKRATVDIYMYMARGGKAKKEKDTHTHSSISAILVLSYVEQTTHDAMQYTFTILDNTYVRMYYTNQAFNLPFV